jgi:DnaK suppressor protein
LDQARDTALLVQVSQTLAELDAARVRLAAGTYGVCERCGRPIAPERLAARPEARLCITCASRVARH